ncbi:MAG: DUF2190 family protein [Sedimentisphaerales bacterium]|nr:DUF2190 family protein [Sedimentisphaerales bacterium]
MFTEAMGYKEGQYLDHIPAAALLAGQMIVVGGLAAFPVNDLAAGEKGSVQIVGVCKGRAAAVSGNVGSVVGWDEDGDPVEGDAGTGAVTTNLADADFIIGSLAEPLAVTDGEAVFRINEYSPDQPAWPNRIHELHSGNYTIDALDMGKVLHVDTNGVVITLPAMAAGFAGLDVIVQNDGPDGTVGLNVSPNAADRIMGPDLAGADNKDRINNLATAKRGDFLHLRGDGTNGWWVVEERGVWTAEP